MKQFVPLRAIAILLCAALVTARVCAEDTAPFSGWKQAETGHFRFIFEDATRAQTEGFARIADTAWNRISGIYSTPPQKTDVIVTGRTDTVNAFAQETGFYLNFFTNPPLSPDFGYREDWQTLFFTHELTHIANFAFENKTHTAAKCFGPFFNIFNLASLPGWSLEGLTTVLETELTSGGRGRSPFFELYYKAPTLENSFIKFDQIGLETEPPRGQIYVMGYLLMRSIADRYGVGALADIERNRTGGRDFEASVKLVTGRSSEELFQDVRIALEKKYAAERGIPEGITVSPRKPGTYYYRPALIDTSGIVTIRDTGKNKRAAVRFDPAKQTETILFEASFADELSLAASENGTIVAALQSTRFDRMPGYEVSTDLYTWTKETGLSQLTHGASLFQPALSRSGNRLVATELDGTRYRLVEIDLKSGKRTVLLESPDESCIQPSLSDDGSQIAFLALNGKRAMLAVARMPKDETGYPIGREAVTRSANESGAILDIAYPSWTREGTILFASNERGRLEVWEESNGKRMPVVSDPVGAIWAERTDAGVYYSSYAGTGYVIKIKPSAEWGKIPSFNGPSKPGEIVTLGQLAADYPDFAPHVIEKNKKDDTVTARKKAGQTTEIQPELQKETRFVNQPLLQFWLPLVNNLKLENGRTVFGAGAFAVFSGYPLQGGNQTPFFVAGGIWYPDVKQANADVFAAIPLYTGFLMINLERSFEHNSGPSEYVESSTASLSFSVPVHARYFYREHFEAAAVTGLDVVAKRNGSEAFAADSGRPYSNGFNASAGLEFVYSKKTGNTFMVSSRGSSSLILSAFPNITLAEYNHLYLSEECSASFSAGTGAVMGEFGFRSRWFDLPADAPLPATLVRLKNESVSCLYPGRAILEAAIVIPADFDTRIFTEKMISFGSNGAGMQTPENGNPLNVTVDGDWYFGCELEMNARRARLAFGAVSSVNGSEKANILKNTQLYFTLKFDALQFARP